jgi:hypothetical protein
MSDVDAVLWVLLGAVVLLVNLAWWDSYPRMRGWRKVVGRLWFAAGCAMLWVGVLL